MVTLCGMKLESELLTSIVSFLEGRGGEGGREGRREGGREGRREGGREGGREGEGTGKEKAITQDPSLHPRVTDLMTSPGLM